MSDTPTVLGLQLSLAEGRKRLRRRRLDEELIALFERWRTPLLHYLATFSLPAHEGEEVVQEVFLALHSHLEQGKPRTNLQGWLFRVAHNLALKRAGMQRDVLATGSTMDALPHLSLNPEEELVDNQRQQRLAAVFRALPEQDRRCLFLRAEGMRYREIADVLGISLGSVAACLHRALARLAIVNER